MRNAILFLILSLFQGLPWVSPDDVGANAVGPVYASKWGWNIPDTLPRDLDSATVSGTNNAVVSTFNSGAKGPVTWTNVRIHGAPELGEGIPPEIANPVKVKWGVWARSASDFTFRDCTVDTIPIEHAWYLGDAYGLLIEGCHVDEVYGQGVQTVWVHPGSKRWVDGRESRHYGSPGDWWREFAARRWDWQVVRNSAFTQVAIPPLSERGSFVLSFFGMEAPVQASPVRIQGNYFETKYGWTDVNGIQRDCAGAIMIHGRLRAEIVYNRIKYGKGDRDLIQLWGVTDGDPETVDILISGNWIDGSKPIDIRVWDKSTKVRINRNRGSAQVVVSSNPPYVWESNGWDESKVIYRGPISKNWSN